MIEQELKKGTSRRRLASLVGVSLGTVQNILLGDTEIKKSTLDKFSRYFNLPIEQSLTINVADQIKAKDAIAGLQISINDLYSAIVKLHQIVDSQAAEIRAIKDRLLDASATGDIKRLDIVTLKGPSSVN